MKRFVKLFFGGIILFMIVAMVYVCNLPHPQDVDSTLNIPHLEKEEKAIQNRNQVFQKEKDDSIQLVHKSNSRVKSNLHEKFKYIDTVSMLLADSFLTGQYDSLDRTRFAQ